MPARRERRRIVQTASPFTMKRTAHIRRLAAAPVQSAPPRRSFLRWFAGLVSNPATGSISHTKLWANIAAGVMTWKFGQTADAPEWLWFAYGGMVGGYALIKRGIAAVPQVAEIRREQNEDE